MHFALGGPLECGAGVTGADVAASDVTASDVIGPPPPARQEPVTELIAPGYSKVISHPMDFSTMRRKLAEGAYDGPGSARTPPPPRPMCRVCLLFRRVRFDGRVRFVRFVQCVRHGMLIRYVRSVRSMFTALSIRPTCPFYLFDCSFF